MISTNEYAQLSANAYNGSGIPSGYSLVGQRSLDSGFAAFAYQKIGTNEVVISIRGMQPGNANDVSTVGQILGDQVPQQYNDAMAFYDSIKQGNSGADISLTGHSLGGALASLVAAKASADAKAIGGEAINATVFNSVGAKQLLNNPEIGLDPNGDYSNINNYNALHDPAFNLPRDQIGDVWTVQVSSLPLIPEWFEREFINLVRPLQLRALLELYFNLDQHNIDNLVNANYVGAENFIRRRDPLTFDLDGDGIETVGIDPNNPILFDHDGDGLKTATGWVAPDDAFLVLDRNGNGTIDSGRELFGDSTPSLAGGNAADGFAALSDQDTNADGQVNANDANFARLRLWRDLNQDGISQAGELFTLPAAGIAAIIVAKTENSTLLPNGNVLADLGHYTKTDGSEGALGTATGQLGDVDLRENTFHSEFTDAIPLTPEAESLPTMHGSGRMIDFQETIKWKKAA